MLDEPNNYLRHRNNSLLEEFLREWEGEIIPLPTIEVLWMQS